MNQTLFIRSALIDDYKCHSERICSTAYTFLVLKNHQVLTIVDVNMVQRGVNKSCMTFDSRFMEFLQNVNQNVTHDLLTPLCSIFTLFNICQNLAILQNKKVQAVDPFL